MHALSIFTIAAADAAECRARRSDENLTARVSIDTDSDSTDGSKPIEINKDRTVDIESGNFTYRIAPCRCDGKEKTDALHSHVFPTELAADKSRCVTASFDGTIRYSIDVHGLFHEARRMDGARET